jgi:AcrR family transcriptional regulator
MSSHRPFHHGNLRAVLLARAEEVLRERGADALSLRELAREAGVSHGAPRSHFPDRAALLDALAERGFARLTDAIRTAADGARDDGHAAALHAACSAYVAFAVREGALLDLMFSAKADSPPPAVQDAAARLFATLADVLAAGVTAGAYGRDDVPRLSLLLSATVQGAAALVASGRMTEPQSAGVIDDAIAFFLAGVAAGR